MASGNFYRPPSTAQNHKANRFIPLENEARGAPNARRAPDAELPKISQRLTNKPSRLDPSCASMFEDSNGDLDVNLKGKFERTSGHFPGKLAIQETLHTFHVCSVNPLELDQGVNADGKHSLPRPPRVSSFRKYLITSRRSRF